MAMVEYDAPPTWFHQDDEDDHNLVFDTSPTTHERLSKGNIGDGASLVPLVDSLDNDCLHDVVPPIPSFMLVRLLHALTYLFMMNMMMSMLSCLVVMLCTIGYHVKILLVTSCLTIH